MGPKKGKYTRQKLYTLDFPPTQDAIVTTSIITFVGSGISINYKPSVAVAGWRGRSKLQNISIFSPSSMCFEEIQVYIDREKVSNQVPLQVNTSYKVGT